MKALCHVHSGMGARLGTLTTATVAARSWVANDAGAASISLPKADADARLLDAGNVFVIASSADVPPWVGFRPERLREERDAVTLPLRELSYLLAYRFTGESDASSGGAGKVFADAVRSARQRLPLAFDGPEVGDSGPYTSRTWNTTSLLDVARTLAQDAGALWWATYDVTPARILASLHWGARRGGDRTAAVVLRDGHHGNLAADGLALEHRDGLPFGLARVVGGTTGGTAFSARPSAQARSETRAALGREKVAVSERISDARSAQQAADAALAESGGIVLRCAVLDAALWPLCGMDETVRIVLSADWNLGRGLDARARIVGVQPDEAGELLELVVAVESDGTAPAGAGVARPAQAEPHGPDLLALADEAHPLRRLVRADERIAAVERRG